MLLNYPLLLFFIRTSGHCFQLNSYFISSRALLGSCGRKSYFHLTSTLTHGPKKKNTLM